MKNNQWKNAGLIFGPLSFILLYLFFDADGLSKNGVAVLAATSWIAIWWITEAIEVQVTALLPIVLFPLSGALNLSATCSSYGHKFIFLFVGGFVLAIAIQKWNLHKRIALSIISLFGTDLRKLVLGFMLSSWFLSMWISNTATTVMMLPIGLAVANEVGNSQQKNRFATTLLLSIAYAASIGGMATLIGTPPNVILAGVLEKTFGFELSFLQWMSIGFPLSIVLLLICWVYLTRVFIKSNGNKLSHRKAVIKEQLRALGPLTYEERLVGLVFLITALLWISRSFLLKTWLPAIDDTIIAIVAALILFILPSSEGKQKLIEWKDAVQLPWGVLILFGGGIALATAFHESGLAKWIADSLSSMDGIALAIVIVALVTAVNFLTEITSNLATTSVVLPVLASLAIALHVHPFMLMVAATMAASCAFMLPVATPPNTIVFGSEHVELKDMMRAGIWMNLISILLISLLIYFLLPIVWGIEPLSTL